MLYVELRLLQKHQMGTRVQPKDVLHPSGLPNMDSVRVIFNIELTVRCQVGPVRARTFPHGHRQATHDMLRVAKMPTVFASHRAFTPQIRIRYHLVKAVEREETSLNNLLSAMPPMFKKEHVLLLQREYLRVLAPMKCHNNNLATHKLIFYCVWRSIVRL